MHNVYFVFSKKQTGESVADDLTEEGFCNQGYFGGGKGDWLVVGGRWSGLLSGLMGLEIQDDADRYSYRGNKDDHQLITEELLNKLKEWDNTNEVECLLYMNDEKYPEDDYIDKEYNLSDVTYERVKGMYITVIDYHS